MLRSALSLRAGSCHPPSGWWSAGGERPACGDSGYPRHSVKSLVVGWVGGQSGSLRQAVGDGAIVRICPTRGEVLKALAQSDSLRCSLTTYS